MKLLIGPYSASCNQGMKRVWLSKISGSSYEPMPNETFSFADKENVCVSDASVLTTKYLIFGQSAAFSGPSGSNGPALQAGILAAFTAVNNAGGIYNHRLHLWSLDDSYVVAPAFVNTQALLARNVHGLLGYYGTGISNNVSYLALGAKVPNFAPYTGSTSLRDPLAPFNRYIVNVRASYLDEVHAFVKWMTTKLDISQVSIFYQNDAFGRQGLDALVTSAQAINTRILSNGSYPANTADVISGLDSIINGAAPMVPQAVFIWAANAAAAAFIREAKIRLPNSTVYLCTSFVGEGFVQQLPADRENIYVAQAFPLTTQTTYPIVSAYHRDMRARDPNYSPSMVSLEGYINARVLIDTLNRVDVSDIQNPQKLIDAIYATPVFTIDKLVMGPYGSTCNQGMRSVFLSRVAGSAYESMPNDTFSFTSECMSDSSTLPIQYFIFGQSCAFSGPSASNGPALRSGILAALAGVNSAGGISNYRLVLWSLDDGYNVSQAVSNTQSLLAHGANALIGYFGTAISNAVAPIATAAGIPYIAPVTGTTTMRQNNSLVINIRASYVDEVNALIHFACSDRGNTRVSIFYQDDPFGQQGISAATAALAAIGLQVMSSGSYAVNSDDVRSGFENIVRGALPSYPQAILVWAAGSISSKFVKYAKQNWPVGRSLIFICPSVVGESFLSDLGTMDSDVYVSSVVPPLSSTAYPIVSSFRNIGSAMATSSFSFEGYTAARLVVNVLQQMNVSQIRDAQSFFDELYHDRVFVFDSFKIGPYIRDTCNQGIRNVWMMKCENQSYVDLPASSFSFPDDCISNPRTTLLQPLVFGFISESSSVTSSEHLAGLQSSVLDYNSQSAVSKRAMFIKTATVRSSDTNAQNAAVIDTLLGQFDFAGLVTDISDPALLSLISSRTSVAQKLLISIPGPAVRPSFDSYHVYLGVTLKDHVYGLFHHISQNLRLSEVAILYEAQVGVNASAITSIMLTGASELKIHISSLQAVASKGDISLVVSAMTSTSVQALLILSPSFASDVYLQARAKFPVLPIFVIPYSTNPEAFRQSIPNGQLSNNLYVSHFLSSPVSNATIFASDFHASLVKNFAATSQFTFGMMEGYLTGQMLVSALNSYRSSAITSEILRKQFFSVAVNGIGPFSDSTCHVNKGSAPCECDLGARSVHIHQVLADNTTPFQEISEALFVLDSCEAAITTGNFSGIVVSESSGVSVGVIIGVIVGIGVLVGAAIGVWIGCARRRQQHAATKAAPKGQVTIVFTDVQDSTRLWDTCPLMMEALETHNDVMREFIERFGGYEVKTQGDSFMVAFQDPLSAIAWSLRVQEVLMEVPWPDEILAEKSCAVEHASDGATDENGEPLLLFRGLRVRIGMHTGFPQLEYNPRTGGIDYFGPTVNCAARVESLGAGGQVLCSIQTQTALNEMGGEDLNFTFLGKFPLKGIAQEQDIVQVSNQRLKGRKFPEIDRKKLVTQVDIGPLMCETCNRPLQCPKCKKKSTGSEATPSIARKSSQAKSMFSQARSFISGISGGGSRHRQSEMPPSSEEDLRVLPMTRSRVHSVMSRSSHKDGKSARGRVAPDPTVSTTGHLMVPAF